MQFLKTLFWVIFAVIVVVFSLRNWAPVSINLWSGFMLDVKLPVLLIIGMLIGFLPTYAVHRTRMWRMKRRLDTVERNAAFAASPAATAAPAIPDSAPVAPSSPTHPLDI